MNRIEVPEDYQHKLLQSMGLIHSMANTTNDESSNLQNLLRTNVSLLNDNALDEEVLDYRNVGVSEYSLDQSTRDPKAQRSKNKNKRMSQRSSGAQFNKIRSKNYLNHKTSNVDKENQAVSPDLK